jgi:hypothetical protein
LELTCQVSDAGALVGQAGQRDTLDRRGRGTFDLAQFPLQVILFQQRIQRRDRLLPHECHDRVKQCQGAGEDQRNGGYPQGTGTRGCSIAGLRDDCGWRCGELEL